MDISKMRLLNNDVLLKLKPMREVMGWTIHVNEAPDKDPNQYFTVMGVSPTVTDVEVGDVVLCPWTRITNPFPAEVDGVKSTFGITSVEEILGIVC